MIKKLSNYIFILVIICLAIILYATEGRYKYFRNKYLECDYALKMLKENTISLDSLKLKTGDSMQCDNNICILSAKAVLNDSYFKKMGYEYSKTDFYGYEITLDNNQRIRSISLYKP